MANDVVEDVVRVLFDVYAWWHVLVDVVDEEDEEDRPDDAALDDACFNWEPLRAVLTGDHSLLSVSEVGGEPRNYPWLEQALRAEFGEEMVVVDKIEGLGKIEEDCVHFLFCVVGMAPVLDHLCDCVHHALAVEEAVLLV